MFMIYFLIVFCILTAFYLLTDWAIYKILDYFEAKKNRKFIEKVDRYRRGL